MSTNSALIEFAPAKINLFLHAGERRSDGYHPLESLVVFAQAGDTLRFEPADGLSLAVDGPFAAGLSAGGDNLVLKAAAALAGRAGAGRGAAITLTKNLPVASGIGGGSADAAAALRGLARLWRVTLARDALLEIALGLGSDVPICVDSAPAWMEGRGEVLSPAPKMPDLSLLLANPGAAVSTADVFRAVRRRSGVGLAMATVPLAGRSDLVRFLDSVTNDLEAPACGLCPAIAETIGALKALPGVLLARMSGSGATCFAIFESDEDARRAADALRAARPNWWVCATHTVRKAQ